MSFRPPRSGGNLVRVPADKVIVDRIGLGPPGPRLDCVLADGIFVEAETGLPGWRKIEAAIRSRMTIRSPLVDVWPRRWPGHDVRPRPLAGPQNR